MRADCVCVHSDTPNAVELARGGARGRLRRPSTREQ